MGKDWNMHGRNDDDSYEPPEPLESNEVEDDDDGYCQDCGAYISFKDGSAYVTASGDVFCRRCGQLEDERQEEIDDEEGAADGWWDYSHGIDIIEDEEYGTYIGPDNDTMGGVE